VIGALDVVIWVGINLVLPLLGIPLIYFVLRAFATNLKILDVISDGQLLMFCAAISAAALYDIGKKHDSMSANGLLGAYAAIIFCLAVAMFMYGVSIMAKYVHTANAQATGTLAKASVVWLCVTLAVVLGFRIGLEII
jgi:hypothetical protein